MSRISPESDVLQIFLYECSFSAQIGFLVVRIGFFVLAGPRSQRVFPNILNGPAMVDGVQVALPHDHELVFERFLFRNALCPECLVLDFQQVLYSGVFVHCCN